MIVQIQMTGSSEDSDSSSSDETVTRDNVIDKVEEYEGHTLDTDTYTYKEPEKILTEIGVSHLLIKMVNSWIVYCNLRR